jgi:hypothetical protein
MRVRYARLRKHARHDFFGSFGAHLLLDHERPPGTESFQDEGQGTEIRREDEFIVSFTRLRVHKHRSRRGHAFRFLKRLVGKEQAVFPIDGKGAQAEATGPVPRRQLSMSGMPILG